MRQRRVERAMRRAFRRTGLRYDIWIDENQRPGSFAPLRAIAGAALFGVSVWAGYVVGLGL